ncbi:MAG: LytTR family transcriptional regulator [Muribaculaceae bacterium]|nr:LytTR family transcriptional regulator [Muribaculaceae bacterium]
MSQLKTSNTTLFFNTRDELIKVKLDKVAYFEADANYCHLYFINGAKATLLTSLVNIEKLISDEFKEDAQYFIRIGKKHIINSRFIFQINIQRQRLSLTDFNSPIVFDLSISKEALKNLKQLYTDKGQWK